MSLKTPLTNEDWTYSTHSGQPALASALLANRTLLSTHNPARAKASVEKVFFRHKLRSSGGPDSLNFVHRSASLSSLTFNLISYGGEVEVSAEEIDRSHFVMVTPLSGPATVRNHFTSANLSVGEMIVLDPMKPFRFEMGATHSHLAIGIPRQRLHLYLCTHFPEFAGQRVDFQSAPYTASQLSPSIFEYLAYICREIDRQSGLTGNGIVATSIEDSLLALMVSGLLSNKIASKQTSCAVHIPRPVRVAEEFMETHLTEAISAADIVLASGVPARTLYHSFCKYRGVSPIQWLKTRRLHEARIHLLHGGTTLATVTDVANHFHFSHVGRFASAYHREFGEFPSDTLKLR